MKRVTCRSKFKLKWQEFDVKSLGSGEALVKIHGCGICASDIHSLKRGLRSWQPIGHEMVGIVEEVGRDVKNIPVGTPVAVRNATTCGECESCREGKPRFCRNPIHCTSGFATHVVVSAKALLPLGKVSLDDAVLIEPLNVAFDLIKTAEVKENDPVVIIGPGPIGILAAFLVDHIYASPIWVVGRNIPQEKLDLLNDLSGLKGIYDIAEKGWERNAKSELAILKNAKFLFTTAPSTIAKTMQAIAPFGSILATIGLASHPKEELVRIPLRSWIFKRHQLRTSFAYPNLYFEEARDALEEGFIPVSRIVSHRFSFDNIKSAFNCVRNKEKGLIKAVVYGGQIPGRQDIAE